MMRKKKLIKIKPMGLTLMVMLMFISCQKEYTDINEPDKRITISANDPIAELIVKVVLKDGSFDNIIDRCSEISIVFPYAIYINDQLVEINAPEDIAYIELDYFQFRDDIELVYPVTVSYSNYSESVLHDEDELEQIQEQYNGNLSDDDIECIDFVYPVELSLYNTEYQKTDLITADDDSDIYSVFKEINKLIIEITFPILVEIQNGEKIRVTDNVELESEINQFSGSCDEDDDVEFEDEDYPLESLIISNEWEVSLYSDTTDETSSFSYYKFDFRPDNTVQAEIDSDTVSGVWEINLNDPMNILEIEYDTDDTPLVWLNDDWMILSADSSLIEMEAESEFDGYKKKLNLVKSE